MLRKRYKDRNLPRKPNMYFQTRLPQEKNVREAALLLVVTLLCVGLVFAQSTNASINGLVLDPTGAAIAGADVVVVNDVTGVQLATKTNGEGIYVVSNLPPGPYRIQVSNRGFKTIIKPDIIIHVQDALAINFTLPIGAASEVVTVRGGTSLVNAENAAVSTVVDRTYVENMPLNGRSFQDLILLTPGVVTSSPQTTFPAGDINTHGEFSVNGQRTESNYYTVDGVSANISIRPVGDTRVAVGGSLPASTSLGTTQALISLDALEEFRVQSSTFSAEYGRNPGGQFSFASRAGVNQWHGTAYDYVRNDVFDANDWFNNLNSLPRMALRQNDFGGTLGGPVSIPSRYNGKDKTFFFFSYEGLRLTQPQPATPSFVPDLCMRGQTVSCPSGRMPAPNALQPLVNAFPLPNCTSTNPSCINPGNGLAGFLGAWTVPSQLDSTGIRFDQAFKERLRLFFRFSDTSSMVQSRDSFNPATLTPQRYTTRTYTLGGTSAISKQDSNEFRLNYSSNEPTFSFRSSNFGGAQPVNFAQLQRADPATFPFFSGAFGITFSPYFTEVLQGQTLSKQRQWNAIDTVGVPLGRHQFKFGMDLRRLSPIVFPNTPRAAYVYFSESSIEANSVGLGAGTRNTPGFHPVYLNLSAFTQDEWHLTSRLSLSLGLRWEVNPAPGGAKNNRPYTVEGSSVPTFTLAPQGTPLWNTTWYNFAPRLGAAYSVRNSPGFETLVRGGGGVFFDTGQQVGSFGFMGPGFSQIVRFGSLFGSPASFPAPFAQINPTIVNPPVPPINETMFAYAPHLQLPYTLQWNASIQQSLGDKQALTISYVGSSGRRLLGENEFSQVNPDFPDLIFVSNGPTSNYNALQVSVFRRKGPRLFKTFPPPVSSLT
jgi:hypothetical protein